MVLDLMFSLEDGFALVDILRQARYISQQYGTFSRADLIDLLGDIGYDYEPSYSDYKAKIDPKFVGLGIIKNWRNEAAGYYLYDTTSGCPSEINITAEYRADY